MFRRVVNHVGTLGPIIQCNPSILTTITQQTGVVYTQLRTSKHWDPKFKKLRAQKVIKVKLPDFNEDDDESLSQEKIRSKLKEQGLQPSEPWIERQMYISNTGGIFEAYVPPEGDGKFSTISKEGAKQRAEFMTKKGKSYMAIRSIKKYEDEFSIGAFEEEAQTIYIKAHEAIARKDSDALRTLVTEFAYPQVQHNIHDKTIRWSFIESLTLPRVVQARCTSIITKDNMFAQLTVRFHNQQTLAVYDRFGRLMHGSEIVKKDVLEYVIFEKHLSNQYGIWRMHSKIIPPWMPPKEYSARTFIEKPPEMPEEPPAPPATTTEESVVTPGATMKSDSMTHATA